MKICVDTNVLVRVLTNDDPDQGRIARMELTSAERVAISIPVLCELVWVLRRGYAVPDAQISIAIRTLMDSSTVVANRPAIEASLVLLEAGGDFADGVIVFEGRALGADAFVSFGREAVGLLSRAGEHARCLG